MNAASQTSGGMGIKGPVMKFGTKQFHALGRMKAGSMNKTEASYAQTLGLLKKAGDVLWFRFEGLKLRLGDKCFYTPDFAVMRKDGLLECHEVKGYWKDDARVKIRVAAEMYPFRFLAVTVGRLGRWETEVFE